MTNSKRHRSARKPAATIRTEQKAVLSLPPNLRIPQWSGRWAELVRGKLHNFGQLAGPPSLSASFLASIVAVGVSPLPPLARRFGLPAAKLVLPLPSAIIQMANVAISWLQFFFVPGADSFRS